MGIDKELIDKLLADYKRTSLLWYDILIAKPCSEVP